MHLNRFQTTLLALALSAAFPVAAQSNAEMLQKFEALQKRVDQLEQELKEAKAKAAAIPTPPPGAQWGMTPEQVAEMNRLTVKTEALEDSREESGFLGRHHRQISVLREGRERELFGWIAPQKDKFSLWSVVLGHFAGRRGLPLNTSTNGGERAMVPIGGYERVMPLDLMATFLLRALVTGDAERAMALGCLELDEEDLALCTFVCPGKSEYGALLRTLLERIEKENT